uniref:Uncharacterized protein n=1 Tax=Vespula pensylvanica TaxID=30213 RepID=A0A834PCP2_VESPE|nr:hypothetical protein H0235_003791 [Vespula pensylvanica]
MEDIKKYSGKQYRSGRSRGFIRSFSVISLGTRSPVTKVEAKVKRGYDKVKGSPPTGYLDPSDFPCSGVEKKRGWGLREGKWENDIKGGDGLTTMSSRNMKAERSSINVGPALLPRESKAGAP